MGLSSTSKDKKKVIMEKSKPEINAVAIPLNVPRNRTGVPNVKSMSHNTWVLAKKLSEKILHRIITYDKAQIKLRNNTSIHSTSHLSAYSIMLGVNSMVRTLSMSNVMNSTRLKYSTILHKAMAQNEPMNEWRMPSGTAFHEARTRWRIVIRKATIVLYAWVKRLGFS